MISSIALQLTAGEASEPLHNRRLQDVFLLFEGILSLGANFAILLKSLLNFRRRVLEIIDRRHKCQPYSCAPTVWAVGIVQLTYSVMQAVSMLNQISIRHARRNGDITNSSIVGRYELQAYGINCDFAQSDRLRLIFILLALCHYGSDLSGHAPTATQES